MADIKQIPLEEIRTDRDLQPRVETSQQIVEEYRDDMIREGIAPFPPLDVFFDGEKYWLADGVHRLFAAREAGAYTIQCAVHQGDKGEALWFSCSANKGHGLRRTNADKARAVKTALRHENGFHMSDKEVGRHVGVDDKTVKKYRDQLEATSEIPKCTKRQGADGRMIETKLIGPIANTSEQSSVSASEKTPLEKKPGVDAEMVSKIDEIGWPDLERLIVRRIEIEGVSVVRAWFDSLMNQYEREYRTASTLTAPAPEVDQQYDFFDTGFAK